MVSLEQTQTDKWSGRRKDRQMDNRTDNRTGRRTDRQMDNRTDNRAGRRTDIRTIEQTDRRIDRWTIGQTDGHKSNRHLNGPWTVPVSAMYSNPFLLFTVNLMGLFSSSFLTPETPDGGSNGVIEKRASMLRPHIPLPATFSEPSFFSSSYCITDNTALKAFPTIPEMALCDSKAKIILPLPSPLLSFSYSLFFTHIKTVGQFFIVKSCQASRFSSNKILSGFSVGISIESTILG